MLVKDSALLLLWRRFSPWPVKLQCYGAWPKKKKKEKEREEFLSWLSG